MYSLFTISQRAVSNELTPFPVKVALSLGNTIHTHTHTRGLAHAKPREGISGMWVFHPFYAEEENKGG